MTKIRSIVLCSSVSFYKKCLELEKILKKKGYKVYIPYTARVMQRTGDYRTSSYKTWFRDKPQYIEKARLMMRHFRVIEKGDAVLVINLKKRRIEGYIGGNALMEMGLAFYLKKPIFLWRKPSPQSSLYEEIMGMLPTIINEDLGTIK